MGIWQREFRKHVRNGERMNKADILLSRFCKRDQLCEIQPNAEQDLLPFMNRLPQNYVPDQNIKLAENDSHCA